MSVGLKPKRCGGSKGRPLALRAAWLGACCAALALAACSSTSTGAKGPQSVLKPRDTRLLHEECDVEDDNVIAVDVDGDGRPERRIVRDDGRDLCGALDFNFDGSVDEWVYWDESGQVRRKESDFDRDGRFDEVALYTGGVLVERHRATTLVGQLDTWQYYEGGRVTRTERDSNGDRYVDQWWEYPDGRQFNCPVVHSDVDGDGRPDPGATVDVCSDGVPTPELQEEPQAKPDPGSLPVETSGSGLPVEQDQPSEEEGDSAEDEDSSSEDEE